MNHLQAQEFIRKKCEMLGIPQIPVFQVDTIEADNKILACFYSEGWYIEYVKEGAKKEVLEHEIGHYVIALIKAAEMAEEKLCDSVRL